MGRPFLTSIPHTSRSLHGSRYRIVFTLFLLAFFQQQHLFHTHRQSLAAKYSATTFNSSTEGFHPHIWRPNDEESQFQADLIASRAAWMVLGEGWEGKVFVYKNSVIKTFTPGRSPFRNCASGVTGGKWPTEIPASLLLGGTYKLVYADGGGHPQNSSTTIGGILSVKAYFMASVPPSKSLEWYLITPRLDGNLFNLAHKLSDGAKPRGFREVDAKYRPAFNRLLKSMEELHNAGYCHDDIKPANIFVQDDTHWMLGDLGNLRQISHPYHTSRLWRDNRQLEDCRANDAMRALKSYLKFIQTSISNEDQFNLAFYEGKEPTSRLFWWTVANSQELSAKGLHQRSLLEYPEAPLMDNEYPAFPLHVPRRTLTGFFSWRLALKRNIDELLITRMGEKLARWWAMTWLYGVPTVEFCGV